MLVLYAHTRAYVRTYVRTSYMYGVSFTCYFFDCAVLGTVYSSSSSRGRRPHVDPAQASAQAAADAAPLGARALAAALGARALQGPTPHSPTQQGWGGWKRGFNIKHRFPIFILNRWTLEFHTPFFNPTLSILTTHTGGRSWCGREQGAFLNRAYDWFRRIR